MDANRALILSIALHVLLAWALSQLPQFEPAPPPHFALEMNAPSEQEKQNALKALQKELKQVVRQAQLLQQLKEKNNLRHRFDSERDQTVLEETKARASGMTANRSAESSQQQSGIPGLPKKTTPKVAAEQPHPEKMKPNKKIGKQLDLNPKMEGEKAFVGGDIATQSTAKAVQESPPTDQDESKPLQIPNFNRLPGLERGESTVGESLPEDIKFGSMTALNTDRYVHYTFYARFEELFRHRWVKYVRAAIFDFESRNAGKVREQQWATRIEIILDPSGTFVRCILHEGSGFKALDFAPVQAMQEVHQVPNPPAEMVRSDGFMHLMYEFDVQYLPQYAFGH